MRARMLFAGLVAIATVVVTGPASAKVDIAEADITGPGLKGGLRIEAADTYGLWDSGIGTQGGLDDTRADSVEELGLTPADLGPRYRVTYRFGIGRASQHLYPYARGGPVTYTPEGQELGRRRDIPDFLRNMPITAGWYRSPLVFFQYLVDHGLPDTNPVPTVATRERAPDRDTPRDPRGAPWATILVVLSGLAALFGSPGGR
ncbi:MAG: hypothetical protein GEU71_17150 [Actinobacteria bacterium]|nr:hypothetical protein [Actinomycetota bacterium]